MAGKSLKYCKLKTTSSQTGDDDIEIGVGTDEIWSEDKEPLLERRVRGIRREEMQFPTLTGQSAKSGSLSEP